MRDHIASRRYFWSCSGSDQAERVAKQRSDCGSLLHHMTLMLSGMSGSAERCARLLPRDDSARQRIWQGDLGVGSGVFGTNFRRSVAILYRTILPEIITVPLLTAPFQGGASEVQKALYLPC